MTAMTPERLNTLADFAEQSGNKPWLAEIAAYLRSRALLEGRADTVASGMEWRAMPGPPAEAGVVPPKAPWQDRVNSWMCVCFGELIATDKVERNHRFLEESLELVQACGCSKSEAHQLVEYVFGRPVGEVEQEAGGVMVTLAALCNANGVELAAVADTELARCWKKIERIREKQAQKPKHSPLPGPSSEPKQEEAGGWRPIDTYEVSMGRVLTLREGGHIDIAVWERTGSITGWHIERSTSFLFRVTHWQPLPGASHEPGGSST